MDIIHFRQQRWETSIGVLAAMVEIITHQGAAPEFDEEESILKKIQTQAPSPDDLLAMASLCYKKSCQPMLKAEETAWLRTSVNAMGNLIKNYQNEANVPALRRVLFYIRHVRGIRHNGK